MKRKPPTNQVFKKKKFQEANLVKVRGAINDACRAYGIATAIEFSTSEISLQVKNLSPTQIVACFLKNSKTR